MVKKKAVGRVVSPMFIDKEGQIRPNVSDLKYMAKRGIISAERLKTLLKSRPEHYGGRPESYRGGAATGTRFDSYGQIIEEGAEESSSDVKRYAGTGHGRKYGGKYGEGYAGTGTRLDKYGQIIEEPEHHERTKEGKLAKKTQAAIAIGGLVAGLLFMTPHITGNAVAGVSQGSTSWIGIVMLLVALVGWFFWIRD